MISTTFLSFLASEIIQQLINNQSNLESNLHHLGKKIAPFLIELYDFERDIELDSLIYKITYSFLPQIFITQRKLGKKDNNYVIYENVPLFMSYMSIPYEGFSSDALIAGIIERVVNASGFECSVNAYTAPEEKHPRKTVYLIEILPKETKDLF
ncbi:transport particle complex subunit [Tubulinosema ratisbonensis]|uniref:Transport particle complex subunit n=1 Tax=Tubulinosema ratisbonensis TaxID=291195 RepID=A0A437AQ41_9MICR|nr:transport particle complex subunit [Tubulinosema ratisbonensis]